MLGGRHDRWDVWLDWADGIFADPTRLIATPPARLLMEAEAWRRPISAVNEDIAALDALTAIAAEFPEQGDPVILLAAEPDAGDTDRN